MSNQDIQNTARKIYVHTQDAMFVLRNLANLTSHPWEINEVEILIRADEMIAETQAILRKLREANKTTINISK